MFFQSYKPDAPLSDFIENLWAYHGFEAPRLRERILPSGTFELVFNLHDDEIRIYKGTHPDECVRLSGAIASGPYTGFFVTDTALEASVVGVHFKPGGAFRFLGIAAHELADRHINLQMILGRAATEIRERLCEAASPMRLRVLEKLLLSRFVYPVEHHAAVALALAALDDSAFQKTRDLAREAGLSERRFIDLFRFQVGLKPKLFNRICRFQRVLTAVHRTIALDWALIAADHGYFDQSHLIRDFVAFSGCTPTDYVRRLSDLARLGLQAKFDHLPLAS